MHKSQARHSQLMKKYMTLALIGAIVAGVAGLISIDAISATSLVTMQGASDFHESGLMIGHVTYEVRGADGQVKQYLQGDNFITNLGIKCAATAMFDSDNSVCASPGNFAYIAIGNATGATAAASDTQLDISLGDNGIEMDRSGKIDAVITTVGANTVVTLTSPPFTFTNLKTTILPIVATTVTQSGLFNSTGLGTGTMFAIKDIPAPVPVTNADTLSVTWTITLANP